MDEVAYHFSQLSDAINMKFGDSEVLKQLEWFVKFRNPFTDTGHYSLEPTFLSCEFEYLFIAYLTYIHAKKSGSDYLWVWFAVIGHGLMVELVSYFIESIDNFWHAQGTIMLFGQREPIHILFLYPSFIYPAWIVSEKLGLSGYSKCACVALFTLINDIPYDIIGVKLLWWVWHDTDPNIRDRHYWVPWGSYYFHLTFAFSFTLIYTWSVKKFNNKIWPCLLSTIFSMPLGVLQFIPLYHLLNDILHIHASVAVGILLACYLLIFLQGLVSAVVSGNTNQNRLQGTTELVFAEIIHFMHYVLLVLFANPETIQAQGLHQQMGSKAGSNDEYDCSKVEYLTYPYPFTSKSLIEELKGTLPEVSVWKRPYLCPDSENKDEAYYDFSCPKAVTQSWVPGNDWYWICGTSWNDASGITRAEYLIVVLTSCILGCSVYLWAFCLSPTCPSFFTVDELESKNIQMDDHYEEAKDQTEVTQTIDLSHVEWVDEYSDQEMESDLSEKDEESKLEPTPKSATTETSVKTEFSQTRYNLRKRKPRRQFD